MKERGERGLHSPQYLSFNFLIYPHFLLTLTISFTSEFIVKEINSSDNNVPRNDAAYYNNRRTQDEARILYQYL